MRLQAGVERLVAWLAAERDRWPLWIPAGLGTGVAIYFGLVSEPPLWFGPVLATAAIALWRILRRRDLGGPLLHIAILALAVIAGGFAAAQVRTAVVSAPVLDRESGAVAVGGVVDEIDIRPDGIRLVVAEVTLDGETTAATPRRVRIRFRGDLPPVEVGARITARAVLLPPPPPAVPGGFDFQRQSFFRGLGAVGFGLGPFEVVGQGQQRGGAVVAWLRAAVIERINRHLDGSTAAVAIALMTGERGAIDGAVMAAIRDSGLAHLLAISGLHIGLVAGVVFVGARAALALIPAVALHAPIKKWAAIAAIAGAGGYALLAGATVPTQRAFLMIALVLVGVLIDRRGLSMRTVAWAAVVILLLSPESLMTASFQLSFAAVTTLIAVYESVRPGTSERTGPAELPRRVVLYLGGVALTTLVASLATSPYVIYHFNRLAAFGLAANVVAVPITALWVMPMAVAAFALMPFGLEALALVPMSWGIEVVTSVGQAVAGWPGAVSLVPPMPVWGLVAITLGGLWLCLWRGTWRWFGGIGLAVGLVAAVIERPPDILVGDTGDLIAVRTVDGGLAFSTSRRHRFERETWLSRSALAKATGSWPAAGLSNDGNLACDPLGCLYQAGDNVAAFIRRPEAALEDCPLSDVVVSTVRLPPRCASHPALITRWDLRDNGVHAIWLEGGRVRITSVNGQRGDRPWVVRPARN